MLSLSPRALSGFTTHRSRNLPLLQPGIRATLEEAWLRSVTPPSPLGLCLMEVECCIVMESLAATRSLMICYLASCTFERLSLIATNFLFTS